MTQNTKAQQLATKRFYTLEQLRDDNEWESEDRGNNEAHGS